MILTAAKIEEEIDSGNIVISDYTKERLNPNSYDLRLADKLKIYTTDQGIIDAKEVNETVTLDIPREGLVLKPGILYLGSTIEYTETHNFVPMIEGKSSIGRLGIDIHKTAGFGDLSFKGRWTLEITVTQPVRIYPEMRIAQIYYLSPLGAIEKTYAGKYQGQKEIIESRSYMDF